MSHSATQADRGQGLPTLMARPNSFRSTPGGWMASHFSGHTALGAPATCIPNVTRQNELAC